MQKTFGLAVFLVATTTVFAQSLTEKIDVSLVNVDVTVTSHGAPAKGLTLHDFEIREDGVPQTITHFYAIENASERPAAGAGSAPAVPTPSVPEPAERVDTRFRRKVLVVVDNRHISRHSRDTALKNLEKFIDDRFETGAYDWSIAMVSDRAHMLLPLTSDKSRIHAVLGQIRQAMAGKAMRDLYQLENRIADIDANQNDAESVGFISSGGPTLNDLIERGEQFHGTVDSISTYLSIRDVASAFSSQPGRKIILLITGPFGEVAPSISSQAASDIDGVRQWLVREANVSNVSFYLINAEGYIPQNLGADVHGSGDSFDGFSSPGGGSPLRTGALESIATETGGRALMGNFVDHSLRDFDVDSANFYSLAYQPNHAEDGKYHRITVSLKKPGRYSLSYRRGYASLPIERQLERAMTSEMSAELQPSSIPLSLTTGTAGSADVNGAVLVPLYATVAAKELQFVPAHEGLFARIDVLVSIFDDHGRLVRTARTVREAHAQSGTEATGNFIESRALRLRKGVPYRVVVAVHDQISDAVGIKSQTIRL